MTQRGQIVVIQYFRALAALMVVAHHGRERLPWLVEQYPYKLGQAGVDIFFVISGFVMIYVTQAGPVEPIKFLKDRITRIVPLYWIATLVMLFVLLAVPSAARHGELSLSHLVLSMLFLFHWTEANTASTFLIVGWTLNYEMMFYGLLALAMLLAGKAYRGALAGAALVLLVAIGAIAAPTDPVARALTNEILLEFILGMALAHAHCNGWFAGRTRVLGFGLLAAGACGMVYGVMLEAPQSLAIGVPAVLMLAGGLIVEQNGGLKRHDFSLLLADASYAIYLFNLFTIAALKIVWSKFGLPETGWMASLAFVGGSLVVGTATGVVVHLWIEKPLLRLLRGQWIGARLKQA